jgi:hypothetical protein
MQKFSHAESSESLRTYPNTSPVYRTAAGHPRTVTPCYTSARARVLVRTQTPWSAHARARPPHPPVAPACEHAPVPLAAWRRLAHLAIPEAMYLDSYP